MQNPHGAMQVRANSSLQFHEYLGHVNLGGFSSVENDFHGALSF